MPFKLNFIFIITFFLISLYFLRAVPLSGDTFWHLSIGRQVWQEKKIPTTDNFIYGPKNKDFLSVEWLSGLVFYILFKNLGYPGLVFLRIGSGLITLYFLYLSLKLITSNKLIQSLGITIVGYALAYRLYDRPEIFSFVFISLINYLCIRYFSLKGQLGKLFYTLPLVFLLWPNIHPFAVVGLAILIFYFTLVIISHFFYKENYENLKQFMLVVILSTLLSLVQYKKFFIFLSINNLTGAGLTEFDTLIQRLWATKGYNFLTQISLGIYIYLTILCVLLFLTFLLFKNIKNEYKSKIQCLFYLFMILAPFRAYRLIPIFLLLSLPIILSYVEKFYTNKKYLDLIAYVIYFPLIFIILISVLTKSVVGNRDNIRVSSIVTNNGQLKPIGVFYDQSSIFPAIAPTIVKDNLRTKNLFTSTEWNNYFIYYVPGIKVFADALFYNRSNEDYKDEDILRVGGDNWAKLIEKYNIDTVINPGISLIRPNRVPVYNLPNWKLIYLDGVAEIYARSDVIKSLPINLSSIKTSLNSDLKFDLNDEITALNQLNNLLTFDNKNGFAREQLITYWLDKDISKAKRIAEESRTLSPEDYVYSMFLGKIYVKLNNCGMAQEFAKESVEKSRNDPVVIYKVNGFLSQCGIKIN